MRPAFHPEARAELEESADWYEMRKPELGEEFLEAVEATIARIEEHPERRREIEPGVRACRTNRFLFAVIYRVRQQVIEIVAVSHCSRRPGYWKGRLER